MAYPKNRKTHTTSDETKQKISLANLGKKRTEEQKKKISLACMGRVVSEETIKKLIARNIGKKMPETTRLAILKSRIGSKHSEETKKHWSEVRKGRINSPETRLKISIALHGKKKLPEHVDKVTNTHRGSKCNFWKGGISDNPYTIDWTATLRRSIRERDGYKCGICGKEQTERVLSIHHIDYNKLNCNPDNLISLCMKCHSATNSRREYWTVYFTDQKHGRKN